MDNKTLHPNTPHVVTEDFDNEIIVVNLTNGNYYSLRDTAAVIWKLIRQKPLYHTLLDTISTAYRLTDTALREEITPFVDQLLHDQMIRLEDPNGNAQAALVLPEKTGAYAAPVLESYSDMQDLLMLDPIHEVDEEKGWPVQKEEEDDDDNQ